MTPLQTIKKLVENGFTAEDLESELYYNDELISYLEGIKEIPPWSDEVSAYHELLTYDFSRSGARVNTMDIFEQILTKESIDFTEHPNVTKDYDFILTTTPKWIPSEKTFVQNLYKENKPISKKDFKDLLTKYFVCLKKKPKWLQDADWLIDGKPLIFVGQHDVSDLHYDTTYLYTFFNKRTNSFEHIVQSM